MRRLRAHDISLGLAKAVNPNIVKDTSRCYGSFSLLHALAVTRQLEVQTILLTHRYNEVYP